MARVLLASLALAGIALPQNPPQHAHVELIARQNSIVPGTTIALGVHFVLEPGWHIYWINSGDSGQPPSFKWQLPPGFTAGEIQWPRPERMQSNALLADYGYHDDVLLIIPVSTPQSVSPNAGPSAHFTVEAKWLICREVCLPDHAQLQMSLPISGKVIGENPSSAKLFAHTEALLPKPVPRSWKVSARSRKDDFAMTHYSRQAHRESAILSPGSGRNRQSRPAKAASLGHGSDHGPEEV
jgi:thiol:disulfide interchange protein DsbD